MRFSPGIYEHAAALIHRRPWEVSRDTELMRKAHESAWHHYQHPLVVVGIDVYNLEAEAYGAQIPEPGGNNLPSVACHPFGELEDLKSLPPLQPSHHPRIQAILEAGQSLKKTCRESEVRIPVCGPFALAIGLVGMNELLMAVIEDPEELRATLQHLLAGQKNYLTAIREAGLLPILFESGTTPPLLSQTAFRELEAPLLRDILSFGKTQFGEPIPCIIGGDAAPIAQTFLETGPGYVIAPSETDQAAFVKTARSYPEIHIRLNLPTSALLAPTTHNLPGVIDPLVRLAQTHPNASVGCGVVPFETRPETILFIRDRIETLSSVRQMDYSALRVAALPSPHRLQ